KNVDIVHNWAQPPPIQVSDIRFHLSSVIDPLTGSSYSIELRTILIMGSCPPKHPSYVFTTRYSNSSYPNGLDQLLQYVDPHTGGSWMITAPNNIGSTPARANNIHSEYNICSCSFNYFANCRHFSNYQATLVPVTFVPEVEDYFGA